jgi:hypothetical protein
VVAIVAVAGGLSLTVTAALGVYLRRRNRIHPRVRSAAPLRWLWGLRGPARTHRRLRRAIRGAHGALAQGGLRGFRVEGLDECLSELENHAFAVDDQLVVASRFSAPICRSMLRGLRSEVAEIELLAARIAATVVSRSSLTETGLAGVRTRIIERLDALDAAHAEIARLETRWNTSPASTEDQVAAAPRVDPPG